MNNFVCYLQHKYGEEAWDNIRRLSNIDTPTFSMHKVWIEAVFMGFRSICSKFPIRNSNKNCILRVLTRHRFLAVNQYDPSKHILWGIQLIFIKIWCILHTKERRFFPEIGFGGICRLGAGSCMNFSGQKTYFFLPGCPREEKFRFFHFYSSSKYSATQMSQRD